MFYTIEPVRCYFTRRGYAVHLFHDDGQRVERFIPYVDATDKPIRGELWRASFGPGDNPCRFYGDDGRRVRAEAIAWAKSQGARETRQ